LRVLLDTHVALWLVARPDRLPKGVLDLLADPENDFWVSAASIWETAIKHRRRSAQARDAVVSGKRLLELLIDSGVSLLPVMAHHAAAVDDLPHIHGDPFDRLLVAQAQVEPMRLVTVDAELPKYGDLVLLV
jgi:PIN domain nuclease of toxin-antitoxin system